MNRMKKKILFLSSRVPYPLVGGDKIRVFNSLKILSKKNEITLLYIDSEPIKKETEEELNKYCNLIKPFIVSKYSHYLNTIIGLLSNKKPLQVNYYYYRRVQKWIDCNIEKYDAVYCNHIRTTEYVRKHNLPKYVDLVDSISMNYEKAIKKAKGFWKMIYVIEKKRVFDYELEIVKEFENKILISEIDKKNIDPKDIYNIKVIGNFVPTLSYDDAINIRTGQLCFLGKMNYEPNVTAVTFFVKEVYPLIKNNNSRVSFKIIGAYPTSKVLSLKEIEGVEVTGFVDNPYNCIQESQIFVAPMISGAGVQNKILEAMKMGKCVVTTEIGAEGLKDVGTGDLIICKTKEEMAMEILSLLDDEQKLQRIGKSAQRYIENNFSEEIISEQLLEIVKL